MPGTEEPKIPTRNGIAEQADIRRIRSRRVRWPNFGPPRRLRASDRLGCEYAALMRDLLNVAVGVSIGVDAPVSALPSARDR